MILPPCLYFCGEIMIASLLILQKARLFSVHRIASKCSILVHGVAQHKVFIIICSCHSVCDNFYILVLDQFQDSHFHHHLSVDVCVPDHLAKLLKVDLSIVVLVVEENSFVHDLLQLGVLQVVAHHHLQHLEQLTI